MKQIIPDLYTFTGLVMGRVYLIEGTDGVTLIDAGLSLATPKILKQLAAHGRQATDVKRILITHAHPDHIGGLPTLQQATGAEVIASAEEKPIIEGRESRINPLGSATTFAGTPVHRVVADGDMLPEVMAGLQVVFTPGHAKGHLAFWQPQKRVVFCGDTIFRLPHLRLPFTLLTPDMPENIRSIRRIADLEPAIVCFGHGKPLMTNTAVAIHAFAEKVGA